ncbi:DMT family transporter [Candidatus Puniceispirillum marinum]|uniref:ABC transporter, membrane spanning protein n=1 Tax=Puniceispirillum marinum (strain IMCC1322) TaxID=488538 RepID=D5BNB9_PUNMI|nr:DMT family transporter [Candidatus Puniceispirillum marinum]ADE40312.1 ABC transporter, membrane spanning protein [Candidatus Puniceispirillum marinum IMCC1322]
MTNKDWLRIVTLGVLWGSSFLYAEILLRYLNPLMIVFLRVSLAGLILLLICLIKRMPIQLTGTDLFTIGVMGALNNVIPFSLIVWGQQTTTGGLASIINASTAFFSILLAALFIPQERLTWNRVGGVLIGVTGVAMAVGPANILQFSGSDSGKYMILLATISYAIAGVWAKMRMQNLPSMISATGMLVASAMMMVPLLFVTDTFQIAPIDLYVFFIAFQFAVICSVLAYLLYFKILETMGAGNLLICTIIVPPSAILLEVLVLDEVIGLNELAGLAIVTAGMIVLDGRLLPRR